MNRFFRVCRTASAGCACCGGKPRDRHALVNISECGCGVGADGRPSAVWLRCGDGGGGRTADERGGRTLLRAGRRALRILILILILILIFFAQVGGHVAATRHDPIYPLVAAEPRLHGVVFELLPLQHAMLSQAMARAAPGRVVAHRAAICTRACAQEMTHSALPLPAAAVLERRDGVASADGQWAELVQLPRDVEVAEVWPRRGRSPRSVR